MMRLRSGVIGWRSAWLPSRRSTADQRGAFVIRVAGHVRSGRSTRICSWNGRYLCVGMPDGFWVFSMMMSLPVVEESGRQQAPRRGRPLERGLVAAAKQEKHAEAHTGKLAGMTGRAEARRGGKEWDS